MDDNLPPIIKESYSDAERALIAGYLVRKRTGTLKAVESTGSVTQGTTEGWGEGAFRYWKDCERYSRYLLFYVGYPVLKNKNYGEA